MLDNFDFIVDNSEHRLIERWLMLSRPMTKRKPRWQPTPPAASAKMPAPEKVIDLGEALKRAYSQKQRRIA